MCVPPTCSVSWCVLCFMKFLFEYMCTRLPFILWSIAGVPSSQALPGYLITAPPSVCVPAVIGVLAVWIQQQNEIKTKSLTEFCFTVFIPGAVKWIHKSPIAIFSQLIFLTNIWTALFEKETLKGKPPSWRVVKFREAWSRSLSFFSALVCDLLPRRLFDGFW